MSKKLVFSRASSDRLFAFKFVDDKIWSIEYCDTDNIVGNLYVGVVADIVKNINAAFVGFSKGQKGFYLIEDNKPVYLNPKNTDKLCEGDRILVQVSSDKVKTKDYTLTSNVTLTGKYVVLTVGRNGINVSKKIKDEKLRNRIKASFMELKNDEWGYIIRTGCNDDTLEDAKAEAIALMEQWNQIKEKAYHLTAGSLVKKNDSDFVRIAKNSLYKDFDEIITDEQCIYEELMEDAELSNSSKLRLYEDSGYPLHKLYSLEKHIKDSLSKKVWLNSGAYLIIEHTEALTVVDVNTGKVDAKGNREEVFLKINIEAAKAIACEIRKRNISGIIIVDFINMRDEMNNKKIVDEMKKYVQMDEITTTVVGLTNLGLMEITRKRTKKPLYDVINLR